jgi:nucleoside-diphosphate-sugar epimerase
LPTQVSSADAFFHLAWVKTTGAGRNDMSAQIRNIQFTMDACQVAKELGCTVFVGAGSQAEYGLVDCVLTANTPCFPQSGYGMAKLCAGQMSRVECERLGIDHVWPRILSVYGPHDGRDSMVMSVINKLIDGEKPSLTRGEQIWDYLYEGDASEALYRLALYGRGGSVYPLGSGTARPLRKYIESIRDTMGSSLDLGFGEIPYGLNQVMYLRADITDLQRDTGFAPRISFDEGIARTISYVRGYEGGT